MLFGFYYLIRHYIYVISSLYEVYTLLFVGYSRTQKGYRCFHPPIYRYIVSTDVTFLESKSYTDVADSVT